LIAVLEEAGTACAAAQLRRAEVGGLEFGIVGAKGFVGGFPGAELPTSASRCCARVYAETTVESRRSGGGLGAGLRLHADRAAPLRPDSETLVG
jgi:hypothetical protein